MTFYGTQWMGIPLALCLTACGGSSEGPKNAGNTGQTGAEKTGTGEPARSEAPDEGVVLGYRLGDGSLHTAYATRAGIEELGGGIAVPRAKGWWKLELGKTTANNGTYVSTFVLAGPADKPLQPPAAEDMQGCTQNSALTVLFVGPNHVSIHQQEDGFCEGAAHPYVYEGLVMRALDTLAERKDASIEEIAGAEVLTAFQEAGTRLKKKSKQPDCLDDVQPTSWGLIRSQGQWTYRGLLYWSNEACRGMSELFSVKGKVPEKLTGPDSLDHPWEEWSKETPGLLDLVVSPKGGLRVEVTADGLHVKDGSTAVGSLKQKGASLVMAQWALGEKNVARWKTEAAGAVARR